MPLPKMVMDRDIANLTLLYRMFFVRPISTRARVICCPSKWKQGTKLSVANAPEKTIMKLQNLLMIIGINVGRNDDLMYSLI